jgi:hypothetical protein
MVAEPNATTLLAGFCGVFPQIASALDFPGALTAVTRFPEMVPMDRAEHVV